MVNKFDLVDLDEEYCELVGLNKGIPEWCLEAARMNFNNYSVDHINSLFRSINSISGLTEDAIAGAAKIDTMKDLRDIASKLHVSIDPQATKRINRAATEIAITIKKYGLSDTSKNSIAHIYNKNLNDIVKFSNDYFHFSELEFEGYDANKISKSVMLVIAVIYCNTLFHIVANMLFGPIMGYVLTAVIAAPFFEEGAKAIATRDEYPLEFGVVFNACEALMYIRRYAPLVGLKRIVGARLFCAGFHFITIAIHVLGDMPEVRKLLNLDTEEGQEKLAFIAHVVSMLVHGLWNANAIF